MCETVIKIREPLPTIKQMATLQSVTRCKICNVLIGEPCYSESEATNCFPSKQEFEKAYGKSNFLSLTVFSTNGTLQNGIPSSDIE